MGISIDRPFGVCLFDNFDQLYTIIVGSSAKDFQFVQGDTPLSTLYEVIIGCITYFTVIFGGRFLMTNVSAINCKALFQLHNAFLTIISFVLLVLLVEQLTPKLIHHEFLHYFHHSMTMALCYAQLVGKTTVSWAPIVLNLIVHVLMYYYYFGTASEANIWWKKYLTTMQIIQFIINLVVIYSCTYSYYAYTYTTNIPNFGDCSGTESAAAFGCAILASYLFLFINFYRITYNKKQAAVVGTRPRSITKKSKKI